MGCKCSSLEAVCPSPGVLSGKLNIYPTPEYEECTLPGEIATGCMAPRVISNTQAIAAGASVTLLVPTVQSLLLAGIQSRSATGLEVSIDDILISTYSFAPRIEASDLGADTTAEGFGDIDFMTPELFESGWNSVPNSDYFNSQYPLQIVVTNNSTVAVAANAVRLAVLLSNQAELYGNTEGINMPQLVKTGISSKTRPEFYDKRLKGLVQALRDANAKMSVSVG